MTMKLNAALASFGALLALSAVSHAEISARRLPDDPNCTYTDYQDGSCPTRPKPRDCFLKRFPPAPCDAPNPYRKSTLGALESSSSGIAHSLENNDVSKAAEGLNSFFEGSQSGEAALHDAVNIGAAASRETPEASWELTVGNGSRTGEVPPPFLATGAEGALIGGVIGGVAGAGAGPHGATLGGGAGAIVGDKAQDYLNKKAEEIVTRDRKQDAIKEFGGCRMKGTCRK